MSEDKVYKDGDIVWVKLGNNWWPGEVTGPNRHPEGLIKHLKRVPYCVVKFFNENTYEYVRSGKQIFPFQCAKQEEFIRKGYSLYNSGNSFMEKFPNDVEVAKRLTRRKETSLVINDRPDSIVKAILGQPLIRTCDDYYDGTEYREKRRSGDSITKILNITQNHNEETLNNKKHGSQTLSTSSSLPSNNTKNVANTSASLNTSNYQCNLCDFTSVRQNVMILHRKMHSNRNSLGSSNTTSSSSSFSSSTKTNSKLTTETAGTTVATATTNVSNNSNQKSQQSEIVNKNKTNSKTKANAITTTTTTATTRATRTPTTQKERNATATPVIKTRAVIDTVESAITPTTPTETNNRIKEIQTTTRAGRTNKSKTEKKTTVKEKKEASAYSAILCDFCPSDTEIPSSPEERPSRRSLRHCKNEDTTTKITTVCIDLSESTKTIQKIPKKREYSSLEIQKETPVASPIAVPDPDVVCLADKEIETAKTTTTTLHSAKPKKDAEEIRRMLLEDWSDDDETPNDTIVVEDRGLAENNENNESLSEPVTEQHIAAVAITSTPVAKITSSPVTGRIRNIPKKDRRDVVLQDFNSDLSLIQADKVIHNTKCMALDLDSSSSSVVEIIEDEQPSIITINDDEEQENSKSRQTDVIVSESKESDSAVGLINEKPASAATSTTTLSCFDFQEEEEEQDTTTPTISHFKKKYLSVEKLQNLSSTNSEDLGEDVAKSRAELAEKDQRLAAEIESLLEQTQPTVTDLLNANSFEESMSVKDLPIKERGKRIFKSRNKTRLEEKNNTEVAALPAVDATEVVALTSVDSTEVVALTSVDANLVTANATIEQYKSLDISTEEEIVNTDKEETNLQQNSENTAEKELILVTDQDNSNNEESSVDLARQEILQNSSHIELPKHIEDQQLEPNENKENEDLSRGNKDSSEVSNDDNSTAEFQKKQKENDITLDSNEIIQNPTAELNNAISNHEHSSEQLLNGEDVMVEQQDAVEETELENRAEESSENSAKVMETELENHAEKSNENCADVMNINNKEVKKNDEIAESLVTDDTNSSKVDTPENKDNEEISQIVEPVQAPPEEDSVQDSISVAETSNSPKDIINNDSELKEITKPIVEITPENVNAVTLQQESESVFKIRVKSPDQLFEPTFVSDSQQEQELQPTIVDGNIDTRLITTTPTDENSSMGASDTGAEFGSPTSMLSEERLPTFRFQSNQTPQPEIETVQRELQEDNSQEAVQETTNHEVAKTEPNGGIKENLLHKDITHIFGKSNQNLLQQRRFSMDLDCLNTQSKSIKRPRLSVDDNTLKNQNTFVKSHQEFTTLTMSKDKSEIRVRPKSRHMKITPRRNVSELFKSRSLMNINDTRNAEKSSLLESVKETQSMEDVVETFEKDLKNHKECDNSVSKENSQEVLKTIVEKENSEVKQPQNENSNLENFDKSIPSENTENLDLNIENIKEVNEENQENTEIDQLKPKTIPGETTAVLEKREESNVHTTDDNDKVVVESTTTASIENNSVICESFNNVNTNEISKPEADESVATSEENCNNEIQSQFSIESDITNSQEKETSHVSKARESTAENLFKESEPAEAPLILVNATDNNTFNSSITNSMDTNKTHNDQSLETPFSPVVPPATPQEREVVIESENLSPLKNTQLQTQINIETLNEITIRPLTPKVQEKTIELNDPSPIADAKDSHLKEVIDQTTTFKENEKIERPITPQASELVKQHSPQLIIPQERETIKEIQPATPPITKTDNETCSQSINTQETETQLQAATHETAAEPIIACETLDKLINPPHAQDLTVDFEHNIAMPCTPLENYIEEECENPMQTPLTPQAKDLIIECEPLTPQGIIECDHNTPAQITPEKEVIVESDVVLTTPPSVIQDKDIIIEDNLQLEEKDTLLEREFQVVHPKEIPLPADVAQSHTLQTDADKAAEEFLIEFDSIVNHSHSVEEDVNNSAIGEAVNADDLINNIIEEVHEDQPLKEEVPTTTESSVQYEPMTTYTVVSKNSWNQIFKESFNRQLPPAKRRQTICFEISDTKEGVACKKQALDFESVLPVSKTVKRTAERKLTLPAIETKLSNSQQQHNIFALNHNQLTLNKKLIPTTKRKLSIEDNITSFIIERPKQAQQTSTTVGPPPLQRIRPLSRQGLTSSKASGESFSEPPPLQSHDNLFNELFQTESSSPTPCSDLNQKNDGARIINQQILSSPAISSVPQGKSTSDTKISKNKQIGVDSRGNKYVIIKTPPTDIIVQPTLTSSTAAAVTATNNFGTTITIQPLPRSSSEAIVTKTTTKNKNVSAAATTSSRKQQQQHMKQISITVPAKSPLEITKSLEAVVKTPPRNKRKAAHAKAVAATAAANSNLNSAKHRQAMEALSRRLSIAAETPPLSKISRTATTHVQTQITNSNTNNSNLATFFATSDPQISNIAQQQLMQLQQQQQQQTSTLPPPIILNKNAHQHSALQRKPRKTPQQLLQQQHQQQQAIAAKSSQLIQQLQQQQQNQLQQQQQQQIQQHFITQITATHQPQQQNTLQPPPLQQIQQQTVPVQQHQQQIVQQNDGIIITTTATEDDNVIDSNTQLIALPTQPYPGYSETFLLCKVKGNTCKPVDNVPLYLNHQLNELVPVPLEAIEGSGHKPQEHQIEIKATNTPQQLLASAQNTNTVQDNENNIQMSNLNCNLIEGEISAGIEAEHHQLQQHHHQQQQHHHQQQQQHIMEECAVDENITNTSNSQIRDFGGSEEVNPDLISNNGILLNIEGQQVLLDAATFAHLLANPDANTQLISDDGTEYVLTHEVLAALQMQQEQQQALELANANAAAAQQQHQQQQEQRHQHLGQRETSDIIAVALAGSELYDSDVLSIDTSQGMQLIDGDGSIVFPAQTGAITQQHLTPPAVVTNAVLDQSPIMSTLEVPSSIATTHKLHGTQLITVPSHHLTTSANAALGGRSNLEDSLAAIGVTASSTIPSSLGLPITVTNPNIASKVTSAGPLNEMLQFVSHRPATAAATAAAVAAAALAGESRIFTD